MRLNKLFAVIALSSLIAACSTTKQPTIATDVIVHPSWPNPIEHYAFDWRVVQVGEELVIGLPYSDSLEFRLFLEDVKRYVKDTDSMICFYRDSLGDPRCIKKSQ